MKLFFILFGMALLISGCSSNLPKEQSGGFHIVQTNFLGCLWDESYARAKIISQDGGQSFAVPGGGLWAFGDTFKGTRNADMSPNYSGGAVSCSIAFLGRDARRYPPALNYLVSSNSSVISPFEYFTNEPSQNHRLWPMGGIYLNGQYYLFYSLIEIFGTGSWDFRSIGTGLARSSVALGPYQRLQPLGNWRFPVAPSCVIEANGWLYLYEVKEFDGKSGTALARVRPEKIEDPSAYEFYTGPGPKFSRRKANAAAVALNTPGQVSVAWNDYLQKYVMASSSDFYHPRQIRFLAADAPYGPWSQPVAVIEVPEVRQGKHADLVYCTYFHSELFQDGGRVMNLSYSLGLKDAGFDANCEMAEIRIEP
ncbi:MAG TPA: DUF4185 domain-containing protein [Pseudomonadales bacterium]|nr:DUF4185 domain-containing protein [Pseudomonadales bacterium]